MEEDTLQFEKAWDSRKPMTHQDLAGINDHVQIRLQSEVFLILLGHCSLCNTSTLLPYHSFQLDCKFFGKKDHLNSHI